MRATTISLPAALDDPRRLIGGRYRLGACIGRGGMGSVWRAEHATLGAPVAVKLIDPRLLDPDAASTVEVVERFLREAQAAAAIRSPHVVQILDHGLDDGTPFMALELLEGESLDRRLARAQVLDLEQTARIVTHVARALSRAHEAGIVHRDLKPSNVFLVDNDDEEIAKVLDFGLAKIARARPGRTGSSLTAAGRVVGTPAYMSPEQAQGEADWRSDLYALAVIAYECLCGRLPFEETRVLQLLVQICTHPLPVPSEVAPVPRGFDAWFAKAAHRDPARRFPSAKAMAEALRALAVERATTSPRSRRQAAAPDPRPRGPAFGPRRVGIAAGVGALAGVLALSLWAATSPGTAQPLVSRGELQTMASTRVTSTTLEVPETPAPPSSAPTAASGAAAAPATRLAPGPGPAVEPTARPAGRPQAATPRRKARPATGDYIPSAP